jgi:transcriptional regulator with XRE-family HTH domain
MTERAVSKPPLSIDSVWFGASRPMPRIFRPAETNDEIVRERLVSARRLNRLDQKDAAKKLGYKNSAPLSKIEGGQAKMPKGFLVKAALAYNVSTDYLLGLSAEPERDPRTAEQMAIVRSVEAALSEHVGILSAVLLRNAADLTPLESHLQSILNRSRTVTEAFEAVCRKNKKFLDEVLAGSRLLSAVDEMRESERAARDFLRHRLDVKQERIDAMCRGESLPLFAGEERDAEDAD